MDRVRSDFLAHLKTKVLGRSFAFVDSTGSTNDDAKSAVESGLPEGHLICADTQHGGRGRRGRRWVSPPGVDLYFSFTVPAAWFRLSTGLDVGLGIARALKVPDLKIKWPNDVLIGEKKCAGILVEASSSSGAVAGVGINVNRVQFDEGSFRLPPTSLGKALGRAVSRGKVLAEVLNHTEAVMQLPPPEVSRELAPQLAFLGQPVTIDGTKGVIRGLSDRGGLLFLTDAGEKELVSGELDLPNPTTEP